MKKSMLITFALCLIIGVAAQGQSHKVSAFAGVVPMAKAYSLDKKENNFGTIKKGTPVKASFVIKNTSLTEPLILKKVKATCGCTATGYSKEPIPPGGSTIIKATYNAAKAGSFTKSVMVYTNFSDKPEVLYLKGKVQ